jgi:hypothetical protein
MLFVRRIYHFHVFGFQFLHFFLSLLSLLIKALCKRASILEKMEFLMGDVDVAFAIVSTSARVDIQLGHDGLVSVVLSPRVARNRITSVPFSSRVSIDSTFMDQEKTTNRLFLLFLLLQIAKGYEIGS